MSKTYIPVALRRQVYERAKACCEYCLIPDVWRLLRESTALCGGN